MDGSPNKGRGARRRLLHTAGAIFQRALGRSPVDTDLTFDDIRADITPATPRNELVALRAGRSETRGREWGFITAHRDEELTPERIAQVDAVVRANDEQWLHHVLHDPDVQLPPETTQTGTGTLDPALAEMQVQRSYNEMFHDVDLLREMPDDQLVAVRDRLVGSLRTPGANYPRGGSESGRAVFAEVQREMRLRPKARALLDQRVYESAYRDGNASLSAETRIELAADARRHGEQWLGADPDSQEAHDFLSAADRQYARAVIEAEPAWLKNTLGIDPSDSALSAERDVLAEQLAHARFGRENLADMVPGLELPAGGRLMKRITAYQEMVGMVAEPIAQEHLVGHGFGI